MICWTASRTAASSPAAAAGAPTMKRVSATRAPTSNARRRNGTRLRYRNSRRLCRISVLSVAAAAAATTAEAARGALRDGAHVTVETDGDLLRRHRRMGEHSSLVRSNLRATRDESERTERQKDEESVLHQL